jgi:hypothetical protein
MVKPGFLRRDRKPYTISCQSVVIGKLDDKVGRKFPGMWGGQSWRRAGVQAGWF